MSGSEWRSLQFWPKLSDFYSSFSRPESSLRAIDARFVNSRLGWDAIHEPCQFLAFFWASQLGSLTGSAILMWSWQVGGRSSSCSQFALQFRIWSTLDERQVPKFHHVELCSVSNTIAIPRQETEISILIHSSLFHHSLVYSNLLEFGFVHLNDEDSMLYIFCLGKRSKKELSYDNDHRLFFKVLSCNLVDIEFPTINYSSCNMSFHYNIHDFNCLCCGPSMIDFNALFSYKKDASDCQKLSSCYHSFGPVNSTSLCWVGWGFWRFSSFHPDSLVNAY